MILFKTNSDGSVTRIKEKPFRLNGTSSVYSNKICRHS